MSLASPFQNMPIRKKLNAIILVTSTAVLFLAAGSFVAYEIHRFRKDLLDQYTTLSGVVAANTAAAIVFNDASAAADTLAALRSDPHVVHASLSRGDGTLFADYFRDGWTTAERDRWAVDAGYESWRTYLLHHHTLAGVYLLEHDHLDVLTPVVLDSEPIGRLFVQVDLARLYASFRGYSLIVAGVLLASLVLAILLSQKLQRIISDPILLLAKRMARVTAGRDYSVRVEKQSEDEIGTVYDGFNEMLAQIERRDQELTQLAAAVQQAPDGIAVLDLAGRVLHANRAFLELSGCAREQLPALEMSTLYPGSLGTQIWPQLFEAAGRGERWNGRTRALRADGGEYDEFCSVAPIANDQGGVVNVLVLKRDISRELQMEERVRESQKLQALGTLAGGIAHDFNNLMSPIVAYSELLLDRAKPGTKDHTRLERITEAAVEASALVKQILAFSRPGSEARQPLPVQALVKECVKLFHMALPPNIAVECEVEETLPPVTADPSQLHQVLMNLLTNAKHAMKDRGRRLVCRVESSTPTPEDVPEFPGLVGTPCVRITVQDEGHGMSPDVRERIFEPFFSTKGLGEGTGMGLAVVRGIVEDHGGAIGVESDLGRGSSFHVYLPVSAEEAAGCLAAEEPAGPVAGSERILLLEEEEFVREPLCGAIALLGYSVEAVAEGSRVVESLASSPQPFDALVLDEQYLGGNGDGLLGRVRQLAPALAVLVCSSSDDGAVRERLEGAGPSAVVVKPVSPVSICAALRELWPISDGSET